VSSCSRYIVIRPVADVKISYDRVTVQKEDKDLVGIDHTGKKWHRKTDFKGDGRGAKDYKALLDPLTKLSSRKKSGQSSGFTS
jgi:hypothetical protein